MRLVPPISHREPPSRGDVLVAASRLEDEMPPLGRLDGELGEPPRVGDHFHHRDLAVPDREGHYGSETPVGYHQDRWCAVDEPGVGVPGPGRETQSLFGDGTGTA